MNSKFMYALIFVSADSKGLVAKATKVLFDNGFNIADSSSTLLHGVFSMILVVNTSYNYSEDEIKDMFRKTNMNPHIYIYKDDLKGSNGDYYTISVYGADKPGIVHDITKKLADNHVNIIDLQTKVTGKDLSKVYIMILEVVVPENINSKWISELKLKAKSINIDITINKIESYEF